jgi:DNA-binding transcriptional LysR family regulator
VLVAHPDYLAGAGTPRLPGELPGHALLAYSLSATGERWRLTRGKRSQTVRVEPVLKANSSLALQQAALQGLGIARIPRFVVGDDLTRARLVRVLPDWELPASGIHLVTTARAQLPRKTRAFIDFFRGRIGDPPVWERGA